MLHPVPLLSETSFFSISDVPDAHQNKMASPPEIAPNGVNGKPHAHCLNYGMSHDVLLEQLEHSVKEDRH